MSYLFTAACVCVHAHACVCVCFCAGTLNLKMPLDANADLSDASVVEFLFLSPHFSSPAAHFSFGPPPAFSDALTCIDELEFARL